MCSFDITIITVYSTSHLKQRIYIVWIFSHLRHTLWNTKEGICLDKSSKCLNLKIHCIQIYVKITMHNINFEVLVQPQSFLINQWQQQNVQKQGLLKICKQLLLLVGMGSSAVINIVILRSINIHLYHFNFNWIL